MDSIYLKTGAKLKAIRQEQGLTQQDLAEKAAISVSFLSFLESGSRKGSLDTYQRLATALGMGLDELFREAGRKGNKQVASIPKATFADMNTAETKALYKLVKTLRRKKAP
jgi:transcriptional regulator with XRE-family HTH domain